MNTMENIEEQIISWAEERKLTDNRNFSSQMIKLMEEVGELSGAIARNDNSEQVDAIGDIQVVLIILCKQLGIDYKQSLQSAYNTIKNRKGKTINGIFVKD